MTDSHATFKDLKGNLIGEGTVVTGKLKEKEIKMKLYITHVAIYANADDIDYAILGVFTKRKKAVKALKHYFKQLYGINAYEVKILKTLHYFTNKDRKEAIGFIIERTLNKPRKGLLSACELYGYEAKEN